LRTQFWATIDHTDPYHLVGGYTDTSAFLAYGSPSGKWNVNAYVKNIEDHADPTYVITNALGTYAQPVPPRTYGIRFTMKFSGAEKSPGGGS
jgi:outer membrane receptor protein involved in Fe transport